MAQNRIGVCSWSLAPGSARELVERVAECGLTRVQLTLDPLREGAWGVEETRRTLMEAGVEIASGMMAMRGEDYSTIDSIRETGGVRVDAHWEENLAAARENARIARKLGIGLVTFHAGFVPGVGEDEALREVMIGRVAEIARVFGDAGVRVGLETGQESAGTLLGVLEDPRLADVGVNFDPANMVLYGAGDPVEALAGLAGRIVQVHLKDAMASDVQGAWGEEVVVGSGSVDWDGFFGVLRERLPVRDLIVERECGEDRVADVRRAVEVAGRFGARA